MKDKQARATTPAHEIPIISQLLHFVSMPVIVFWRAGFGYSYLRPKSVFLASSFACFVAAYIVHNEASLAARFGAVSKFLAISSALYLLHLIRSLWLESRFEAKHDQYSGTSHLVRVFSTSGDDAKRIGMFKTIVEPIITLVIGLVIQKTFSHNLGSLLFWIGLAFFLKELIRSWLTLRRRKRQSDNIEDAEENAPSISDDKRPATSNRKPRRNRQRTALPENSLVETQRRYAEILRLLPPYTIENAEKNFRMLIKEVHPDTHGSSDEATRRTRDLTEALDYFRSQRKS